MPADWQLPPGVSRTLWDYVRDPQIARSYDEYLGDSSLPRIDTAFVTEHCPRPGRLLDLGCGTGRLCVALAARGYRPLAVDLSEEMLRVVAEKAAAAHVDVDRLKANVVELDCLEEASFDYAACLFSTLGMIQGAANRRRAIEHVFRLLRPGGIFVVHAHNLWFNFWTSRGRCFLAGDLWRRLIRSAHTGDYDMPPHLGIGSLTLHLFTRRELRRILTNAGFHIVAVRPLSLRPDGRLRLPWWCAGLRCYGYLAAAQKPLVTSAGHR